MRKIGGYIDSRATIISERRKKKKIKYNWKIKELKNKTKILNEISVLKNNTYINLAVLLGTMVGQHAAEEIDVLMSR